MSLADYTDSELDLDLRWWDAANYLTVAQIYLQDNVLLREPLKTDHIKPRLLGHWGTSPGLSLIYTLLNRRIRDTGSKWLYVTGPGHGGPALVASTYLEGTYSEIYPHISPDAAGLRALCRQFSTPGGVPSHVSVQTPGSIHEGGELGYALIHAAGAAFDNPELVVACVVGDGEAETGPLSGSWKIPAFLNPVRDGAVLPILHLNGAKIAAPDRARPDQRPRHRGLSVRAGLGCRCSSRATIRDRCSPTSPGPWPTPMTRSRTSRPTPAPGRPAATSGRPSCFGPPRAGPARTRSTAN